MYLVLYLLSIPFALGMILFMIIFKYPVNIIAPIISGIICFGLIGFADNLKKKDEQKSDDDFEKNKKDKLLEKF